MMVMRVKVLFCVCILSWDGVVDGTRVLEKEVLDKLLSNDEDMYDHRIRPTTLNETGATEVTVNMYIRSFQEVDSKDMSFKVQLTFRQQWFDDRLVFKKVQNRTDQGKLRFLTLNDPKQLWTPDTFFRNSIEEERHGVMTPNNYLRIFPDGTVLYSERISLGLKCPMNLRLFPFDTQTCKLQIASYGWTTDDLFYAWKSTDPVGLVKELYLPEFGLMQYSTDNCDVKTSTGEYSCLLLEFNLKRESTEYVLNFYIPTFVLVVLSLLSPDNKSAPTVHILLLLALNYKCQVVTQGVTQHLAYTKSVDIWSGVCNAFIIIPLLTSFICHCFTGDKTSSKREVKEPRSLLSCLCGRRLIRLLLIVLFIVFNILYWTVFTMEKKTPLFGNVTVLRE